MVFLKTVDWNAGFYTCFLEGRWCWTEMEEGKDTKRFNTNRTTHFQMCLYCLDKQVFWYQTKAVWFFKQQWRRMKTSLICWLDLFNLKILQRWNNDNDTYATKSAKVPMCFTLFILCLATYVDLRIQNDFELHLFCLLIHFPCPWWCYIMFNMSNHMYPISPRSGMWTPSFSWPSRTTYIQFWVCNIKDNKASSKSIFFQVKQKIPINWRLLRTPRVTPGGKLGESRSTNLKCWSHHRQNPI